MIHEHPRTTSIHRQSWIIHESEFQLFRIMMVKLCFLLNLPKWFDCWLFLFSELDKNWLQTFGLILSKLSWILLRYFIVELLLLSLFFVIKFLLLCDKSMNWCFMNCLIRRVRNFVLDEGPRLLFLLRLRSKCKLLPSDRPFEIDKENSKRC